MKTIKQTSKILIAILIVVTSINSGFAQERTESLEKSFKLNSTGDFTFTCYDTDLKINTWKKDEVKLTGELIIKGGKKEDQDKLIEVFKNPEVSKSGNSLSIKTNMAKNTIIIGPIKKITLVDGKTIRVDKYKATYTLWIPESVAFNLKSKYNEIDIASLTGNINFDLYDVDLTLVSFGQNGKLKMKYSSASIGKGGDAVMEIYDCELEAIEMIDVEITSKYSGIDIGTLNTLNLNSYDDEIEIGKINSLSTQAKYSNYNINGNMLNCIVDFYDSDITAKNIDKLVYSAKYSSLKALDVKSVKINNLYDSNINLGIVGKFTCTESKYDEVEFDAITKSIHFTNAYTLNLRVAEVKSTFENFTGNFKYGSVNMELPTDLEFSVDFQTTHSDVDFPKDRLKIKDLNIEGSSKYSLEGTTSENAKCKIKFIAYDTNFDFD
ncbi:MAG: hypothetical protein KOO66_04810 [Bacteroidales bacterium]|nr:hypothetical protein [Bacteroidales bacterium]